MRPVALLAALLLVGALAACAESSPDAELRARVETLLEAALNGDLAALEDYVSDTCSAKEAFLEQAGALQALEPVEVEVPEGALLFDVEDDVAVAKRAREGPAVLVDGEPAEDDPANDVPLKLVREDGAWRVANCEAYVAE